MFRCRTFASFGTAFLVLVFGMAIVLGPGVAPALGSEGGVVAYPAPSGEKLSEDFALEELWAEFRWQVGYWKSRHVDTVKRNEQLAKELRQAKGEIRTLRDEPFGRKD